jgi:hypothetical protein
LQLVKSVFVVVFESSENGSTMFLTRERPSFANNNNNNDATRINHERLTSVFCIVDVTVRPLYDQDSLLLVEAVC